MKPNLGDFEKLILGFCCIMVVLAIIFVYITKNTVDANMVYLMTILISGFVARKGLKYHYQYNKQTGDIINNLEDDNDDDKNNSKKIVTNNDVNNINNKN